MAKLGFHGSANIVTDWVANNPAETTRDNSCAPRPATRRTVEEMSPIDAAVQTAAASGTEPGPPMSVMGAIRVSGNAPGWLYGSELSVPPEDALFSRIGSLDTTWRLRYDKNALSPTGIHPRIDAAAPSPTTRAIITTIVHRTGSRVPRRARPGPSTASSASERSLRSTGCPSGNGRCSC